MSDFGLSRIKIMGIQKSIDEKSVQKCAEMLSIEVYEKISVSSTRLANFCVE